MLELECGVAFVSAMLLPSTRQFLGCSHCGNGSSARAFGITTPVDLHQQPITAHLPGPQTLTQCVNPASTSSPAAIGLPAPAPR